MPRRVWNGSQPVGAPEPRRRGARIVLEDVFKVYWSGRVPVYALRGVSLEIGEGELVVLMGPSGSGKTTLINLIGGLDRPSSGRVIVGGVEVSSLDDKGLTLYRRRMVGIVFQFFNLLPSLTAAENVEAALYLRGVRGSRAREEALHYLSLVGMEGLADRFPHELSGGQQQRVAVARALAKEPSVLLADEPTGSLDSGNSWRVLKLLERAAREMGVTTIIASHDPLAAQLDARIVRLRDGKIVGEGGGP